MIAFNNLRHPFDIQVGQRLRLPPPQHLHRVRAGETLNIVSKIYAVDPSIIIDNNYLTAPYLLRTDDVLGIPMSRSRRVAAPSQILRSDFNQIPVLVAPKVKAFPKPRPTERQAVEATKPKTDVIVIAGKPVMLPAPPQRVKVQSKARPIPKRAPRGPAITNLRKSIGFLAPIDGKIIAAFGGQADGRHNDGVNIAAPKGTAVRAAQDGKVVYSGGALQGYGKLILVKHRDGWVTAYAHLDTILVKRSALVVRGETIGAVGTSGGVSAPQLHFEMRHKNKAVNPKGRLDAS
jgi:murein DD-endopeptidase MepM/ murein hydrolase activator NlpD